MSCPHLHTEILETGHLHYSPEEGVIDTRKIELVCVDCGAVIQDAKPIEIDFANVEPIEF